MPFLSGLAALLCVTSVVTASAVPTVDELFSLSPVDKRQSSCSNSPTSRNCWSDGFDINTDFYLETPDTGVTREYWLSVEKGPCALDGVTVETCLTYNGSYPGPLIEADWGDILTVHVTNNLPDNGTTVHWHGIRQLNSSEMDGVPGVTQCPIAPGDTMTYSFRLRQYGTTWYHSHFTLQYGEGLIGPLTIHGPASANYDEDLGTLFLQDWSHEPIMQLWASNPGAVPTLDNTLLNGTNTYTDADGNISGKKFELNFEAGKKYRLRLINVAVDGTFDFHIDGHNFTVIANDLVPLQPFETDHIQILIGQRYDIIIEANAETSAGTDFWLRGGWNQACGNVGKLKANNETNSNGIIRYDASSTADPTTTDKGVVDNCLDTDRTLLNPVVEMNVTHLQSIVEENLFFSTSLKTAHNKSYLTWTLNSTTFYLDWSEPTLKQVHDGNTSYADEEQVVTVGSGFQAGEWVVLVIDAASSFIGINHPIHLHGHDFFILAQEAGVPWDGTTSGWNFDNPNRRDVAALPSLGYFAIAFQLDNPGAWIVHCHIAWHASEGLAMQFVESADSITTSGAIANWDIATENGANTCTKWGGFTAYEQDDSGI
ncbi:hypothetical protein GQ53DRAFT_779958 [Thozetella sp. PMI_491]|nr:hypothetical protein GQ53DRAFT_779958 [Thozetella sp. PMI_491]